MPLERIVCIGASHRTAAISERETLGEGLESGCERLLASSGAADPHARVNEIAWLSTCHRVEVYALPGAIGAPHADLTSELLTGIYGNPENVAALAYEYRGRDAVRHLCRVACGLDSMILGEPQILGQVGDALKTAQARATIGPVLSTVFRGAIRAGREARRQTAIGASPASMCSVAMALAAGAAGPLRERRVLVIGLGEMGSITLQSLRSRRTAEIAVANRSRARADEVAARHRVRVFGMDELGDALEWSDIVISATRSPHPIIDAAAVRDALERRAGRPVTIVDMAVPRDVDPAVRALPGVHLFDADDMSESLDAGRASRESEIEGVERIIAGRLQAIEHEVREIAARPLIRDLHRKAEAIRREELESMLRRMGDVDDATREHLTRLSRVIVRRLLRDPIVGMEETARGGRWEDTARTIRKLFDL